MRKHLLALDQGTTSTRAILFDADGSVVAVAQQELPQHFPQDGWVEHDPIDLWQDSVSVLREVLERGKTLAKDVAALGITNQRETTLLWDRKTGEPLHRAIVWQDRRTSEICDSMRQNGLEPQFQKKTGLLLDPYFSGTKLKWLLDNVPHAREKANAGQLAFGTVDSFLLWRLTGGGARARGTAPLHATDPTNASRTLLYDLAQGDWSADLCAALDVPMNLLPEIRNSSDAFGETHPELFGTPIPIRGILGDQQAALAGQACLEAGQMKATFGTGCFTLLHTGKDIFHSKNRLLTTVANRINNDDSFALEGSIFHAGTVIQWLRDGLGLFKDAAQTATLAATASSDRRVYLVPAFTGLGAPHWDPHARGAIHGITRDATAADLIRAGLEASAFQTADLLDAQVADGAPLPDLLRIDGGMAANDWFAQSLADITRIPIERPANIETTAWGAAAFASLSVRADGNLADLGKKWRRNGLFEPAMSQDEAENRRNGWSDAVRRVLSTS
ncbi:MAG: glycerol kinase GlpK [Planctomycetes bacterium]|nr:glycerol kinase GlpK [Planctomycetota bacterium]MBT4029093.1 glycerol kinase GlpK [Planctomycetota bacterium]MBT4560471.1 glycerol kinase GlpK [Planctomycetota bacterium]MBT5101678.1 glycerol kinase GlpK [Planctomycetota bacterium]MBT5119407.1 glycerol kinase GlpK [Planctomycetota bacterium]